MKLAFRGRCLLVALWGAACGVHAQNAPVGGIYTCVDGQGRKLTSDRPIPECLDREQKVLNPSGTVAQKVGPSLTAAERAQVEAKERREALERSRQLEEHRREKALLTRFPNRAMHDKERADALEQVAAASQAARIRLAELEQQRKKLDDEMEFYRKDPSKAPQNLRRQVEENTQSMNAQKRFIADQDEESRRVNARFDDELVRLRQLWAPAR
jgi:hypothetical protein